MAKALVGYLAGPSYDHAAVELAHLRRRVADLENEIARLKAENDGLVEALGSRVDDVSELLEPVTH
ncbi:hypothetical protein [uncultured Aeromicrobium sp.]|uniref:hypothetical protein n=1 Tax=uncultured Aeromicrobium sp. TaxID=337820 RepID=UPI0026005EC2|nr:hypothetical protein [uncultured Aeromicrobium sp.]